MTDIQAAIGREQLKRLPAIVARRRELAARYDERLQSIDGVIVPREPRWARTNWQSFAVRLPAGHDADPGDNDPSHGVTPRRPRRPPCEGRRLTP